MDSIPTWGYVFLLMPFLICACCIRSFRNLAYLSFVGQMMSFVGYFVIICFSFISLFENHPNIQAVNWKGIPIFFGMVSKLTLTVFISFKKVKKNKFFCFFGLFLSFFLAFLTFKVVF